ncbi:MAG TPA: ABC transporter substrate-binding protein [Candidatus Nanopelagicaceae bacterium]|nr:ABC transporter substrate-binding protein [Candidatus Nanopelagicaceae bacterium]
MYRSSKKVMAIGIAMGLAISALILPSANASRHKPFPVKIKTAMGMVTIKSSPKRIISLSPTATEMLFAIGAGKQVIAVDDQSTYPAKAPHSKLSGFTPNLEAIAAMHPDLVIDAYDTSSGVTLSTGLGRLRIKTMNEPAANKLADVYSQILALGTATGHAKRASKLVTNMKKRIAVAIASAKGKGNRLTFFHELDNTLYTATSKTFIGSVYSDFGLWNIADAAVAADQSGYPQLSSEYVVASNPDLIFLADAQYGESPASVKARAGFSTLKAVRGNHVFSIPSDISSRWGPRIVNFYEFIAKVIAHFGK